MVTRLEMLVDKLDGQLAKRRKELTDIRLLSLSSSGSRGDTLRRAGHVMAYAHWEGFSKFAFRQYLEYLCDSRVSVNSLKIQLRALSYWNSFKSAAAAGDFQSVVGFMESFAQAATTFTVEVGEITKTGNLDSRKFRSFLELCALDYRPVYQTRENFIDQVLCGRRHLIAHGLLMPISPTDLIEAIDGAMELCEEVNAQLQEALIYDEYIDKKPSQLANDSAAQTSLIAKKA
jgi:hypothetical protein